LNSPQLQHLLPDSFLRRVVSAPKSAKRYRNALVADSNKSNINQIPLLEFKKLGYSLKKLNKPLNKKPIIVENVDEYNCSNGKFIKQTDLENIFHIYFGDVKNTIEDAIEKNEIRYLESERREIIKNEWSDVAMILDHFLCYFFSFLTIITCAAIFLSSPHTISSF
jgi:hypothetical protein